MKMMSVEPEWYYLVISSGLVNDAHDVETDCSIDIPSYNLLI